MGPRGQGGKEVDLGPAVGDASTEILHQPLAREHLKGRGMKSCVDPHKLFAGAPLYRDVGAAALLGLSARRRAGAVAARLDQEGLVTDLKGD